MEVVKLRTGYVAVRFGDLTMAVVIPSRKREEVLARCPLLPVANVFVHVDERESYESYLAEHDLQCGTLSTHTAVGSIASVRNSYLDALWPDEGIDCIFTADDDFVSMLWMFGLIRYHVRDIVCILEIVAGTAMTAREMGAPMFGYHQSGVPVERDTWKPFSLRSWVSTTGAGFLDRDLRFDPNAVSHDDIDYSLQAIAKHHMILRDSRWYAYSEGFGKARDVGGLAGIRSSENEQREFEYLQAKWGSEVVRTGLERGAGITVRVRVPS